jgi:acyl carrier protein
MILEKLTGLIADQFGVDPEDINADTSFFDDLSADSIDIVELMMSVEEEFDIGEIEENALETIGTVGDVVNYISAHIS